MESKIRGLHSRPRGRNRLGVGGVRETDVNAQTNTHKGGNDNEIKQRHPVGKRFGIFSQAPAHRRPLNNGEAPSLRSDFWSSLLEG